MAASVYSLFRQNQIRQSDWSNQELAEFYRVESALVQAGIQIETDRGLSDEGDPWFAFCRVVQGDVFLHFARIDGFYVIAGETIEAPMRGQNFRELINRFSGQHPTLLSIAPRSGPGARLFLHPSALLAAIVATAFFQHFASDAVASEIDGEQFSIDDPAPPLLSPTLYKAEVVDGTEESFLQRYLAVVISAMALLAGTDHSNDISPELTVVAIEQGDRIESSEHNSGTVSSVVAKLDGELGLSDGKSGLSIDSRSISEYERGKLADMALDKAEEATQGAGLHLVQDLERSGYRAESDATEAVKVVGVADKAITLDLDQSHFEKASVSHPSDLTLAQNDERAAKAYARNETGKGDLRGQSDAAIFDRESHDLNVRNGEFSALKLAMQELAQNDRDARVVTLGANESLIGFLESQFPVSKSQASDISGLILGERKEEIVYDLNILGKSDHSALEIFDAKADALLDQFLRSSETIDLVSFNGNAVFVETDLSRYEDARFSVRSWQLDDGSTISIMGIVDIKDLVA